MNDTSIHWWQRDDLCYQQGRLYFAGFPVEDLATQFGSPSFIYSCKRVLANISRVKKVLAEVAGQPGHRVFYAMKANRFSPLLTLLKQSGLCGIDACSPQEVEQALSCGFLPQEISFTATSLSEDDFNRLARYHGLLFNADSLHAIREWGKRKPGSKIGIRINPAAGVSRAANQMLQYAGDNTTKFGVYREQFLEALELAGSYGMTITRIHFHTGCGYLTEQLPVWRAVIDKCLWFIDQTPTVRRVNIGGGLGVPHLASDKNLELVAWGNIIKACFSARGLAIDVEPGDYVVKDAGLLLLGVTFLEQKRDKLFLGVDGGFNLAPEPAYYNLPFQPVSLQISQNAELLPVQVVGNINEALDVWYRDAMLPPMSGQRYLALLNAGAYSSAMASNHCMRGSLKEFLLV
jgi:diaminopimelate decarboxylase